MHYIQLVVFFRGGVDHLPPFKDNVTVAEDFHSCTQLCRRRACKCAVAAQSSDNCGNSAHFSLFSSLPPGLRCFPLLLTSPQHQPALRLLLPQMGFCCSCSAHLVVNMSSTLLSSTDGDRGKTIPPDQCPHNSSSLHHQKSGGLVVAVVVTISLSKLSPAHNSR